MNKIRIHRANKIRIYCANTTYAIADVPQELSALADYIDELIQEAAWQQQKHASSN